MQSGVVGYVLFVFFNFFISITAHSHRTPSNSGDFLSRLLGSSSSKPVLVFLDFESSRPRSADLENLLSNLGDADGLVEEDDGNMSYEQRDRGEYSDDNPYFLSHLLRNAVDNEALDQDSSSNDDGLGPAMQVLRTALRARCQKVDKCAKKCPPKKPSCPANCQAVFDNLNLCPPPPPPPKKCRKPKCGKTLPPDWSFRGNRRF